MNRFSICSTGTAAGNFTSDGIVAESFINGPEYTVLIVGSYDKPGKAKI